MLRQNFLILNAKFEAPASDFGPETEYTYSFVVFLRLSEKVLLYILSLGFLLQLIVGQSSKFSPTVYAIVSVVQ
jgi:hypothetical protein